MTTRARIADTWFEWDKRKSQKNLQQRGFDFTAAAMAFFDERAVRVPNSALDQEERFDKIAWVDDIGLIVVVYTVRDYGDQESYRIISAREATKTEQTIYFRGY